MSHRRVISLSALFVVCTVCLGLSGCGKKKSFTDEEFKSLKIGMTKKEVQEVLGTPDRTETAEGGILRMFWDRDKKEYCVALDKDGKLLNNNVFDPSGE